MKLLKFFAISLAGTLAFNAHAADDIVLDSTVQAAYQCQAQGIKDKVPLYVMYGIKDNQVRVAQIKLSDGTLSQGLWAQESRTHNVLASAYADGTVWTTAKSNGSNVHRVDGGTLTVKQNGANVVILDKCTLDKKTTAQLNG